MGESNEKSVWIVLTSNNCPSCPVVIDVIKRIDPDCELKELNVDTSQEAREFAVMYGITYKEGIPTPQAFLVIDGYPTYIYSPMGEDEDMMEMIILDRLDKLKKKLARGKAFLLEDMKEMEIFTEKGEVLPALTKWLQKAFEDGFLGHTVIWNKEFYVDLLRLGQLVENKFECLCFKGLKCPCPRFQKTGVCTCGVFFDKEKYKPELEKKE